MLFLTNPYVSGETISNYTVTKMSRKSANRCKILTVPFWNSLFCNYLSDDI